MGPRSGPGSEGSKGSKGSEDGGIAIGHACGVKVDGPKGPKVLKVLRFDSGFAAEGGGIAQGAMSIYAATGGRLAVLAPLWWLAPPPLPRCEACHWILSRLSTPYESSSLATPLKQGHYGCWRVRHMILEDSVEKLIFHPLNRGWPPKAAIHNPRPKGPSNLSPLGAFAPSILRTFYPYIHLRTGIQSILQSNSFLVL